MESQKITVTNVKCGGCVANIKNGLATVDGVESVEVELASGVVDVSGSASREALTTKLAELGYPEVS